MEREGRGIIMILFFNQVSAVFAAAPYSSNSPSKVDITKIEKSCAGRMGEIFERKLLSRIFFLLSIELSKLVLL